MSQTESKKITRIEDIPKHKEILDGSYAAEWIKVGLSKGPRCTFEDVKAVCDLCEVECDYIIWATDPVVAGRASRLRLAGVDLSEWKDKDFIDEEWVEAKMAELKADGVTIPSAQGHYRYGQHDAGWVGYLLAYEGVVDVSEAKLYEKIVRGSGWWFHAKDMCIMTPRVTPTMNNLDQLHNTEGPAIWERFYALMNMILPEEYEWIVSDPSRRTREHFDSIDNAEVRRVAIASYPEAYMSGRVPDQLDDYGELFRAQENEEYSLVKVRNACDEKEYWLRVPPETTTARGGIAATFGLTEEEYCPEIQT